MTEITELREPAARGVATADSRAIVQQVWFPSGPAVDIELVEFRSGFINHRHICIPAELIPSLIGALAELAADAQNVFAQAEV